MFMALLFLCLTVPIVSAAKEKRPVLTVGGIPFGVRFATDGIMVVGYCDVQTGGACRNPAREAGLMPGDCIYKMNEKEI